MPAASIVLALVAFVCVGLGFLATPIPVVGTVFSFAAPMLAIGGIVAGGVALSRARHQGRPGDAAIAGIVLSALALIPALLVAMTCGVCNALFTVGGVEGRRNFDVRLGQGRPLVAPDAGVRGGMPPLPPFPLQQPPPAGNAPAVLPPGGGAAAAGDAPTPRSAASGTAPPGAAPAPSTGGRTTPRPAFPPPPLAPTAP